MNLIRFVGVLLCICISNTMAGGFGGRQVRAGHHVYDSTVTTEMGYHENKSSKKAKKSHHAQYEYIPGEMEHDDDEDYDVGKGKGHGKGHDSSRAPSGKGKGKGKGKGAKSSKKGKKGGYFPTEAPHPTPTLTGGSQDFPTTRPPSPIVEPTQAPVVAPPSDSITSSPTDEDSVPVELSPFALVYELADSRQASRAELEQLVDVTRLYLEDFMFREFEGTSLTVLDDFITKMITNQYIGDEYIVDYSAEARFNPFSSVFPGQEQMDEALEVAFAGENLSTYMARLGGLPSSNVFRNANVIFGASIVEVAKKSNAAPIAAAAVAATLLAAGFALYKRKSENTEYDENDLIKAGDATVAGETYAGETHDGTASIGGASLEYSKYKDEEASTSHPTLGTITEDEDDDSVRQTWGAPSGPSFDEMEQNGSALSHAIEPKQVDVVPPPMAPVQEEEKDLSETPSFDDMALQGLSENLSTGSVSSYFTEGDEPVAPEMVAKEAAMTSDAVEKKGAEVASLLSFDSFDEKSESTKKSAPESTARRPRTISEIEAMLSAEMAEDEECTEYSPATSKSSLTLGMTSKRSRTVEEIESLLSGDNDDALEVELD